MTFNNSNQTNPAPNVPQQHIADPQSIPVQQLTSSDQVSNTETAFSDHASSKYAAKPSVEDTLVNKKALLKKVTEEYMRMDPSNPKFKVLQKDVSNLTEQVNILQQSIDAMSSSSSKSSRMTYRDLPQFCLEGQSKSSNSIEVFKTAEDYLNRFERILVSNGVNIENDWKRWLYCAMDGDAAIWYKDYIQNQRLNWESAKSLIINHFDAKDKRIKNALQVVTMKMNANESVIDFGLRFQGAFRSADWIDNEFMGVLCLKALTKPLQTAVLFALQGHKDHHDGVPSSSTVVLSLAKDIHAQKRAYSDDDDTSVDNYKSSRRKLNTAKTKFCSYHKKANHNTEECRHLKTQKSMVPLE
ncbi:unnamed protein product [Cunninghamella echinulata]